MRSLPSGTVTFLFTDIEGSTKLLRQLGEDYAAALAEHRRILREAFARGGGVEVDTRATLSSSRSLRRPTRLRRPARLRQPSKAGLSGSEWAFTPESRLSRTRVTSGST
jgi:hypothetical protein